jgi:replicative DNA helicase
MVTHPSKESQIISSILNSFKATKEWPSYDFLVKYYSYECRRQEISLQVENNAEAVNLFEIQIDRNLRYELGTSLVEISKMTDTEEFSTLRSQISKSLMLLDRKVKKKKVSHRERYNQKKSLPAGVLTFIKAVDNEMGGVRKGTTMTLAGFAGHYKTRTFISMLYKNAIECKQNGVMLSLELTEDIIWDCILSRHSMNRKFAQYGEPVPSVKIMDSQLTDKEYEFIFDLVEEDLLTNKEYGKIEVLDRTSFSSLSPAGIRSKLMSLPFDVDFMGVDYVQLFRNIEDARSINDPGNYYMDFFNEMAIDFDGSPLSMVVLAQINRDGYKRAKMKGGEYDLFDLAELNSIERDSSYVVTLFLDENLRDSGEVKVNMPKNRFGSTIITPIVSLTNPSYCIVGDELDEVGALINEDDMVSMLGESELL